MRLLAIDQIRPWMLVLAGVLLLTAGLEYAFNGKRAARWADTMAFVGWQLLAGAVLL